MPILLDGKTYQIDQKFLTELKNFAIAEYSKLDEGLRFAGKAISREMLRRMEKSIREKTGSEEKALAMRPDKKQDATLFLLEKLFDFIGTFLQYATIRISTTESGAHICGLTIENPSRGPMVTHGDIGIRQDNRSQISG